MSDYPALLIRSEQKLVSLKTDGSPMIVGRASDSFLPVRDPTCSRKQLSLEVRGGKTWVTNLSTTIPGTVNGEPLGGSPREVRHGDVISFAATELIFQTHAEVEIPTPPPGVDPPTVPPMARPVAPPLDLQPQTPRVPPGAPATMFQSPSMVAARRVEGDLPIKSGDVIGREKGAVQVLLDHPAVSRQHARFEDSNSKSWLIDLGGANGSFVNGERIRGRMEIKSGDRLDIGPFQLEFLGDRLRSTSPDGGTRISARDVTRTVISRSTGQRVKLVDGVSLTLEPRRFVCILGPSGSGKSTLMNALSARAPADQGEVKVNGVDLYANFESLKQNIALVPQKEVLHELLTVKEALTYTARLRLPPDTSPRDVEVAVQEAMDAAKITPRRDTVIASLSGGQQKRASLANEIICKPRLLFLDEMTSGLDEQTDREMMALFREMADGGKTVICVTHSLANVAEFCHEVIVLTPGGLLAFHGTPAECLQYFGVERLGDVYVRVATGAPESWRKKFDEYRVEHGHLKPKSAPQGRIPHSRAKSPVQQMQEALRQFTIIAQRTLALLLTDRRNLLLAGVQSLVVGLLIAALASSFKTSNAGQLTGIEMDPEMGRYVSEAYDTWKRAGHHARILFLMGITCIWLGCNNTAKELVKERHKYERERDVNLSIAAYFCAKAAVFVSLGLVQAVIVYLFTRVGGFPETSAPVFLFLVLAMTTGTCLGLFVSALAKTEDQAATLVPLVLIPQIILSGAVGPVGGIVGGVTKWFITARWSYEGLIYGLEEKSLKLLQLTPASTATGLAMQILHLLIFFGGAWTVLVVRDKRSRAVYSEAFQFWLREAKRRLAEVRGT